MARSVLVLQHAPWETPALIEAALGELPIVRRTILEERSPELPALSELLGLVVMGGPQDANDDQRYPGLPAERRLLAEAVNADLPVLGVCLGMQLLGLALGATLHLQHGKEIGFAPVTLTEAGARDPVLGVFAAACAVAGPSGAARSPGGAAPTFLHWHSDAVELPRGAELLASTAITPVQSFRIGSALGTQFHPEVDAALLQSWLATPTMVQGLAPGLVDRIRADGEVHLPALRTAALAGLGTFADAVRRR